MTGTKERLLELLEKNRGQYISGEEAAKQLDISSCRRWIPPTTVFGNRRPQERRRAQ